MTTKEYCLSLNDKQTSFAGDSSINIQFNSLNLNHNNGSFSEVIESSKSFTNDNRKEDNYDFKTDSQKNKEDYFRDKFMKGFPSNFLEQVYPGQKENCRKEFGDKEKNSSKSNNSTLSLHIAAYEKSVEGIANSNNSNENVVMKKDKEQKELIKKWKNTKQLLKDSTSNIKNSFEYPRQQKESDASDPEVMQFKASQKILNPGEAPAAGGSQCANEMASLQFDPISDSLDPISMDIDYSYIQPIAGNDTSLNNGTASNVLNAFDSTMEKSGYVDDIVSPVSPLKASEETDGLKSPSPEQSITPEVIDLTEVYSPVIFFENATHLLKDKKKSATRDSNLAKPAKMERTRKAKPACITIESSSEEDDIESDASSEYSPTKSRESSILLDDEDSDKSASDSDSPKPRSSKRKKSSDSSEDGSVVKLDSDEEFAVKKTKKNKRRRIVVESDEDDVELSDNNKDDDDELNNSQKVRTRRMLERDELEKETVDAEEAEKERRKRLAERQKEFNGIQYETVKTEDGISLMKKLKNLILDDDKKSDNPRPVAVHPSLVRVLKSHQAEGIQFMYESAFESLEQFRDGNRGGGGILAHCMGLGKTLQVIAFLHTILTHKEISKTISKVLVVVPKNVVLNWRNEFDKWLGVNDPNLESFQVYELDSFKENRDRLMCLRHWKDEDGPSVMIIGYDMFRILTEAPEDHVVKKRNIKAPPKPKKPTKKQKKFQTLQVEFRKLLQNPGADLVVLDEAHKLKNDESLIARTMLKIQTRRRICLTGTPLQNNLKEYYVMVSFVKPNLLGTVSEFKNQFQNIIERGKTKDASEYEVRLMRKRCFVLFDRLSKIVQRKDISVLKKEIPGKLEYVLKVRLTEPQIRLYKMFLEMIAKEPGGADLRKRILPDYHIFSRIWTHPFQLIHHQQELERKNLLKDDMDGFIDDDDEVSEYSDSDLASLDSGNSDIEDVELRRGTRQSKRLAKDSSPAPSIASLPPEEMRGWWSDVVSVNDKFNLEMSNKLVILFDIIKRCEAIGDKLLVFSQSLESLRLIRNFLEDFDKTDKWFVDGHECLAASGEKWGWKRGIDYLVIDGSVGSADREYLQERFNKKTNLRARLMLISTRAGSLGTNMVAANRVVIFDSCWNPSHDTQSLFRVYRIGQTKPVYIYRLIAQGTMEDCIYKRQVTKDSVAMRVVDEAQIERHFHDRDLKELYTLSCKPYNESDPQLNAPPRDRLLGDLILKNPSAVVDYVFHDNLFENVDGEKLTPEEISEAWDEYNTVKNNPNGDQQILNRMHNAAILQANPDLLPANQALLASSSAQPLPNTIAALIAQMQNAQRFIPNIISSENQNRQQFLVNGVAVDPQLAKHIKSDIIFNTALNSGLSQKQATQIAYIKMIIHILMDKLPPHIRSGVVEIGTIITNLLGEDKTPEEKVRNAITLFTTCQQVFRRDLNTSTLLEHYLRLSNWLAPPRVMIAKPR